MADPRGFLKFTREGPQRRPVELRVKDYKELYDPFEDEKLKVQGARCMDCGVPFLPKFDRLSGGEFNP